MTDDPHQKAKRLITQSRVEGITSSDQQWLDAHVEDCLHCAGLVESTERTLRSLRSVSVALSPGLVPATRRRVQAHVQQLNERRAQIALLSISCALSWALGLASAPWVWRVFSWLGKHTHAPAVVWQLGFAMWWALPAVAVVIVVLVRRAQETAGHS